MQLGTWSEVTELNRERLYFARDFTGYPDTILSRTCATGAQLTSNKRSAYCEDERGIKFLNGIRVPRDLVLGAQALPVAREERSTSTLGQLIEINLTVASRVYKTFARLDAYFVYLYLMSVVQCQPAMY